MLQVIFCDFGSFGLGNAMLIHARAFHYQKNFGGIILNSRYGKIRLGPILRSEIKKRTYFGCFKETPYYRIWLLKIAYFFLPIDVNPNQYSKCRLIIFNSQVISGQLFDLMMDDSIYLKQKFLELLKKRVLAKIECLPQKEISIHIRRGDFKLAQQETKLHFFISSINNLRDILGRVLPVTIFTDAKSGELSEIMQLENIAVEENDYDIIDMLSMTNSKIIILSASSTFGYWAGFFQQSGILIRPVDWQDRIQFSDNVLELALDPNTASKYIVEQSEQIIEYYNQSV